MAGDSTIFKQLAQKLDLCEPEHSEQTEGAWLESNKTAVVVTAMIAVSILLYNSYCYFSNKAKNKTNGKNNEKKIKQEEESDNRNSGKRM